VGSARMTILVQRTNIIRVSSDRYSFAAPEKQPCKRNTGNKDENIPDLAKENFRQDDLPHDQDCAEREAECRPAKWARRGGERGYKQRGADEEREQTRHQRPQDRTRLEGLEESDCGCVVSALGDKAPEQHLTHGDRRQRAHRHSSTLGPRSGSRLL